ncbi:hypothetical protein JCM8202_003950 [Rhodotorula sphaerocarpa]
MDRSYGSSTSVIDTPTNRHAGSSLSSSLLNKAQLARSLAPSGPTTVPPLSFDSQNLPRESTQGAGVVKSVRFSPAQQSSYRPSAGSPSAGALPALSSASSNRLQHFATPQRAYGSSVLLRTASNSANAGAATPPRSQPQAPQQNQPSASNQSYGCPSSSERSQQPGFQQLRARLPHLATPQRVQTAIAKSSTAVHAAQEGLQHAGVEAKKKLEVMPLGRGEAARRLRVNAVLLVSWWVSSRTMLYRKAAGHLVASVPQLDTPLHVGETLLLLVLCWNILDALRLLNRLSSLPASSTSAPLLASSPALLRSSSLPALQSPARSSPKTRPSPSMFGSPSGGGAPGGGSPFRTPGHGTPNSPFRASVLRGSPHPPTPQTPTSALRGSPSLSVTRSAAHVKSGDFGAGLPPSDDIKGALLAFEARHGEQYGSPGQSELVGGQSPASARIKIESREDVERLLQQDES